MQIKQLGTVFRIDFSIKFVIHNNLSTMKKIIIATFIMLSTINIYAQKSSDLAITSANIETVLTGKWNMVRVQPKDKLVMIKGFTMKGTGYGEIIKTNDDGTNKTIISKIFGLNQNSIVFADGEGMRVVYKIVTMSKNAMQLTDGVATLDFIKE
jgi:hypothetical protein